MKKSNFIKWELLKPEEYISFEEQKDKVVKRKEFDNDIQFHVFGKMFEFSYKGVMIVSTKNTNKFLRNLFNENGDVKIWIDNTRLNSKNIHIINSLTKVSDLIDTKASGDIVNYLREFDAFKDNKILEMEVSKIWQNQNSEIKNLTELNLSKASIINFLDVIDEFVSKDNINDVLTVISKRSQRQLIILNDVDYLDIENLDMWFHKFDFIFLMNSYEENYKNLDEYNDFTIWEENNLLINKN